MRKWLWPVLFMMAVPSVRAQPSGGPWDISFRQLTDDIHLAYRPEPLRFLVEGNVTIIVNSDDVVVVDGSGSRLAARQVIDYIRKLTPNPVSVLVNTHGHGDHTLGNEEYVLAYPGVEIVSRPETYEYMTGSGIGYVGQIAESTESRKEYGAEEIARLEAEDDPENEAILALMRQYYGQDIDIRQEEYRQVHITPATVTFTDRLTLHRGEREIQIRYLGPGDTHGDAVVYLPQDRVVATGDMVVHPIPYGFSRHPLEWVQTLDSLAALDFDILIPGHGDVQRDKSYLYQVRDLLRNVQRQLRQGLDDGLDLEGIQERMDLDAERALFTGSDPVLGYFFGGYFIAPNIQRTYDAMTGQ